MCIMLVMVRAASVCAQSAARPTAELEFAALSRQTAQWAACGACFVERWASAAFAHQAQGRDGLCRFVGDHPSVMTTGLDMAFSLFYVPVMWHQLPVHTWCQFLWVHRPSHHLAHALARPCENGVLLGPGCTQ